MDPVLPPTPEHTPRDVLTLLESGEPFQIMDVRAPERVRQGAIDLLPPGRFHNIRGSVLMRHTAPETTGLSPDMPVVVVCGRGKDSAVLAFHLGRMGFEASSLAGGMEAWMDFVVPRELDPPQSLDRLIQFDRPGKGSLSYLLVSEGEAVLIDPPFRVASHLETLEHTGAEVVAVADTHAHADYVSGGPALAGRTGVPYHLHAADAVYPYDGRRGTVEFTEVAEGDRVDFGRCSLEVVHTPGHTEGSVSYLVEDRVAFTGDFLFVESIGRPDLGGLASDWGNLLWDSVRRVKEEWSGGIVVYPGHYASKSERRLGRAVGIALADLLEENEVLGLAGREAFVEVVLANQAPVPEAYRKIKAVNLGLSQAKESEIPELELGRHECSLGG
jgi:glyoxylase-like metal-dependent hydrolase (beta-lactamase superfamily II)